MQKQIFLFTLLILLLQFFISLNANAQNIDHFKIDSTELKFLNKTPINKQYFKSYLLDTRDIFVSPMHWNSKQWMTFGGLSLSFSLLLNYDDNIRNYIQKNKSPKMDHISEKYLEPWGSGYYSMSTMALLYLTGSAIKNERFKKVALLGAKTYLVTGFVVLFPKNLLGRKRPYQGEGPYSWNGFGFRAKSFVSGHTTSAFSIATIVSSEFNETPIVPIISYGIATLAGYSRMNDDEHWLTDIIGGAFFGYAMGKLIYNKNNWKLKVSPYSVGNNFGVFFTYPIDEKNY